MTVRDEQDILDVNLRHHLGLVDEMLVIDNGSSDDTPRILRRFARRFPQLRWTTDSGDYLQAKLLTQLALEAHSRGAQWVVAIDADEFWRTTASEPLSTILDHVPPDVRALEVPVINYAQARWVERRHRRALLTMTCRSPSPVGPPESAAGLVEQRHASYVETAYAPKLISRASDEISIGTGNHRVDGLAGYVAPTSDVLCLHAPLRARDNLSFRAANGYRYDNRDFGAGTGWQGRRWARLDDDELDLEWRANSYVDQGIDVHGFEHPMVVDTLLRETVVPYFSPWDRAIASIAWRRHARRSR
jgi:glycosyltransferase involved in cell wall biosynthesis